MDSNTPDLGPQQAVKCGERKVPATTAARAGMGVGGRWYSRSTCPAASNAGRCARRVLTPNTCRPLASPCLGAVHTAMPCHASCATAASNRAPHPHPERGRVDWSETRRDGMPWPPKRTLRCIAYLCSPSFRSSRRARVTRPLLRRGCAAVRDARPAGGKDRVETSHTGRSRPHRAYGAGAGPAAVAAAVVVSTVDS